jgi:hypothetical protein
MISAMAQRMSKLTRLFSEIGLWPLPTIAEVNTEAIWIRTTAVFYIASPLAMKAFRRSGWTASLELSPLTFSQFQPGGLRGSVEKLLCVSAHSGGRFGVGRPRLPRPLFPILLRAKTALTCCNLVPTRQLPTSDPRDALPLTEKSFCCFEQERAALSLLPAFNDAGSHSLLFQARLPQAFKHLI